MKPIQIFAFGITILFLMWASLFITTLNQSQHLSKLAKQNQQLALQDKQLSDQNKNLLKQIQKGNDSIHSQINCVLEFFAQSPYARTNSSITDLHQCIISTSGGSAEATKSTIDVSYPSKTQATKTPVKNNPVSNQKPSPTPQPSQSPNLIQRVLTKVTGGIL